jgi:hypothetical protein
MAAVAYNFKKLLKYQPKLIESNLKALKNHFNEPLTEIYLSPTIFD